MYIQVPGCHGAVHRNYDIVLERGRGMERGRVMELTTIFGAAAVLVYLAVLAAVNVYAI